MCNLSEKRGRVFVSTILLSKIRELEELVARIRHLRVLFRTSPKDAREALKRLLHDGIELYPLEEGRYRASWTVRVGGVGAAQTVSTIL